MTPPLQMNFDLGAGQPAADGVVHLLKILQNAPYLQSIKITSQDNSYTRNFTGYDAMRMQVRLRQDQPVLFELTAQAGQLVGYADRLEITFDAATTKNLNVTRSGAGISETPFVYDLVFINDGVVVERFAQGSGIIVTGTTL
jgi:hypothetical protein